MSTPDPIQAAEARLADLRQRAAVAEDAVRRSTDALGAAVAAGDEAAAASARRELAAARALHEELAAAVPHADRAVEQARTAREEADRAAARAEAARLGDLYGKSAARIDAALRELAGAFAEHEQLRGPLGVALRAAGESTQADALGRRAGPALARAVWHAAPALARSLGLDRHGIRAHETPLSVAERVTLGIVEGEAAA